MSDQGPRESLRLSTALSSILDRLGSDALQNVDSLSLLFYKPFWKYDPLKDNEYQIKVRRARDHKEPQPPEPTLSDQIKKLKRELLKEFSQRKIAIEKEFISEIYFFQDTITWIGRLKNRLIINHASNGFLENAGACLHPFFNYPMIPGSSLKGVAQHEAWLRWKHASNEKEKKAAALKLLITFGWPTNDGYPKQEEDRRNASCQGPILYLDTFIQKNFPVFGREGEKSRDQEKKIGNLAGNVVFFPAIPLPSPGKNIPFFELDILNPHYKNYYEKVGKGESDVKATDNESPEPHIFPVVRSGIQFIFALRSLPESWRKRDELSFIEDYIGHNFSPIQFAEDCLKSALTDQGIGAKTTSGYGFFEFVEEDQRTFFNMKEEWLVQQRRARMSSQERKIEEWKNLGAEKFVATIRELPKMSEEEQRIYLQVLLTNFPEIWQEAKKAKKEKQIERKEILTQVANKLGVVLP